ncbi:MAG: hypothetical protein HND44_01850 [Chloroflexi bacterium]|nr:hypothetical protein [Ardenticatenaceae bacterium]MBL1127242.1 hypothetical protein [Chloroflexota bacterium]NOG33304.1 hypothetical protein [Chloroflexota bacterium]GIK56126.1 MAG: hypothetical protein BroJett015_17890 [Chloroflexota bacterium]
MRAVFSFLLLLLVIFLVGLLCLAVIMGWSVGVGWLLIKVTPFTLFEATLLVMIASIVIGYGAIKIMTTNVTAPASAPYFPPPVEDEPSPIPTQRFYKSEAQKTNEAWFRYEMANAIYWDFDADDDINTSMNETEMKQLAIRLSEVLVGALKSQRPKRGGRLRVTVTQLKKQMDKMGQRPYDDDILLTAVSSINDMLNYDEDLLEIVQEQTWDEMAKDW